MKNFLKIMIILGIFLVTSNAAAELATDKAAHFGMSFAMQMFLYGSIKQVLSLDTDKKTGVKRPVLLHDKFIANVFAGIIVGTVGMIKEFGDMSSQGNAAPFDGNDMLANLAGIGAAAAFTFVFEF